MSRRLVLPILLLPILTACGAGAPGPQSTTAAASTAAAVTSAAATPFTASVHDVISQINLQLPLLVTDQGGVKLPTAVRPSGAFGGQIAPGTEVYLSTKGNAFSPVQAVTVRVTGSGGAVQTPTRLLSGIGVSLHALASEAIEAFRRDALPHLSAISTPRSTITVGKYYDLTVVVIDPSKLAFVYTPIGISPEPEAHLIGA
ncbi:MULTISPECIES: hypothetical protein [unclassified Crossiella]|uniref:hypothetical protein n=1 Tax=unclassified Crossiella TaxID=2620835 RepID=UPI001FFFBD68|nr:MULTISPECIES: hypothetical protein [unclassified Crossiella]MCK2240625.1 hypothetical protein [Crossiella sp. S99.2]MCK2252924.1 hypothetical protein [Crossiella sp. S99.1]